MIIKKRRKRIPLSNLTNQRFFTTDQAKTLSSNTNRYKSQKKIKIKNSEDNQIDKKITSNQKGNRNKETKQKAAETKNEAEMKKKKQNSRESTKNKQKLKRKTLRAGKEER